MKKSSLVKLSLATVVAAIALTVAPNEDVKAYASAGNRVFDGNKCSGDGGNCLPSVVVKPENQ